MDIINNTSPKILDGRMARTELKKKLMAKISAFKTEKGFSPILAIIQVGDRPDTVAYVRGKKAFATEIGVEVRHVHLPETASPMSRALSEESGVISQEKIMAEIRKLNVDDHVTGIIVQLPLPTGMDKRAILDAIDPAKDTDGLAASNVQKWSALKSIIGTEGIIWPATARAVRELLDFYGISLKGKRVCVVGRSELVGAPIAAMCRGEGAEVVVCHSQTVDLKKETLSADIIISVVGKAGLITADHVKAGQVIVDVGINEISVSKERLDAKSSDDVSSEALNNRSKRKLVGDVDFNAVQPILGHFGAITPVPGGVGPMTVLALFENLADQCML